MVYKASWDRWTWGITIMSLSFIIFIFFRYGMAIWLITPPIQHFPLSLIIFGLVIMSFVVAWLFSPQKYILTDDQLLIKRPAGPVRINLTDIIEVWKAKQDDLPMTTRRFGSGGLFGFFGTFYNTELGNFTMYATQRRNRVLINTRTMGKIIITPDDLGLCEALAARIAK